MIMHAWTDARMHRQPRNRIADGGLKMGK